MRVQAEGATFDDPGWIERERELVAAARRGDREAFASLYAAFAPALYARVLVPHLGEAAAAEEALAETFRAALERLAQFEHRGPDGPSLYHWLRRIARNKATDQARERARRGRALAGFEALAGPLLDPEPGADARLEAAGEAERLRRAVAEVLAAIHPRYRRALELRVLEERDRPACAEALGVTVATFDVVLLRAVRAFRARWTERHGVGGEGAR